MKRFGLVQRILTQILFSMALPIFVPGIAFGAQDASGFPLKLSGIVSSPLVLAQGPDAIPRVYLGVGGHQIDCFDVTGRQCDGFPQVLGKGHDLLGAPVASDLDGDGIDELVLLEATGTIHVFAFDGTSLNTFERANEPEPTTAPSIGNFSATDSKALLFGDAGRRIVAIDVKTGRMLPGFPKESRTPPKSRISVGFMGNPSRMALFWGSEDGRINGVWAEGNATEVVPGFPVATGYSVSAQPALGDLLQTGHLGICAPSQDFKVHGFSESGDKLGHAFPADTGDRLKDAPAIALFKDTPYCVVSGGDGRVHAFGNDGKARRGFPAKAGSKLVGSPIAVDLDADGSDEILAADTSGKLFAFKSDGRAFPGFPTSLQGVPDSGPVATIWQDAVVILQAAGETLHAIRHKPKSELATLSWPQEGGNSERTGVSRASAKMTYQNLAISPDHPRAEDSLTLTYDVRDVLGRSSDARAIRWLRNKTVVPDLDGNKIVPPNRAKKGEVWQATFSAENTRVLKPAAVTIANTPPPAPVITLSPEAPNVLDTLRVQASPKVTDADGDTITYAYRWFVGGKRLWKETSDTLAPGKFKRGDQVSVEVIPSDGTQKGQAATATVRVENAIPKAPKFHLSPKSPKCGESVSIVIDRQEPDPDGDKVFHLVEVMANNRTLPLARESLRFDTLGLQRGAKLSIRVSATDGIHTSAPVTAEAIVDNCPPPKPIAVLVPAKPNSSDTLSGAVAHPVVDADGDEVAYAFEFFKEGKSLGSTIRKPPKKERLSLVATASDGLSTMRSTPIFFTVGNTPPKPPKIRWTQDKGLHAGSTLAVKIATPASDVDGDKVTLRYAWRVNGNLVPSASGSELNGAKTSAFRKSDRVEVSVVPFDGKDEGVPAKLSVVIGNTPPEAPQVTILPANPRSGDAIEAKATAPERDADGDELTLAFRWFVNGLELPLDRKTNRLPEGTTQMADVVEVKVSAFDGQAQSKEASAHVKIGPKAPDKPLQVAIEPSSPSIFDEITCASQLAEGTSIAEIRWFLRNKPLPMAKDAATLPPKSFASGASVRCEVVATRDGLFASTASERVTLRAGPPPSAPEVVIEPTRPKSGDDLFCRIAQPSRETSGLAVQYRYAWFADDAPMASDPNDPAKLNANDLKKGPTYRCEVVAYHEAGVSPAAKAERQYANTLPNAPKVELVAVAQLNKTVLECQLVQEAFDSDNDQLTYRFIWWKDGVEQALAPSTQVLPARFLKPGQKWRCGAQASDEEGFGSLNISEEIQVPPIDDQKFNPKRITN